MRRYLVTTLLAAAGFMAAPASPAAAQIGVDLEIYWTWGDDGWHPHPADYGREGVVVYPAHSRAVRVPPGHLPPPGFCRVWYPGVPPGHQPPPRPCGRLLGVRGGPGTVIVGGGVYRGGSVYLDRGLVPYGERYRDGGRRVEARVRYGDGYRDGGLYIDGRIRYDDGVYRYDDGFYHYDDRAFRYEGADRRDRGYESRGWKKGGKGKARGRGNGRGKGRRGGGF